MAWQLLQTEKSYKIQLKGVYTLVNTDNNFKINKIELTKKLVKMGIVVNKITTTNVQQKSKKKGRHTILQFRPKKYFVILEKTNQITEENVALLNA